jgi:hypothetical protein
MSIGRPSFYLASLLEDAETRLLYDRLVLERDHPESKLLIPKFRRKKKFARHPSSAIEAIVSAGETAHRQMPQTDSQVPLTDLNETEKSARHSSHDEDS